MIRNREYTKALLSSRQARTISQEFRIPFETVCADRARIHYNRERRKEISQRRMQARRALLAQERTHVDTMPYSFDQIEAARRDEDRHSVEVWCSLPLAYEDEPRSRPWDGTQAVLNTMRLKRSRPQAASYAGVSGIYDLRGTDMRRDAA